MRGASSLVGDGGKGRRGGGGAVRTVVVERKHRLDFFSSRKKKGGSFVEKTPKTYGVHPGRRRAYLPGRFEVLDAEGRVGCGIDGSTSLCRKMGKKVSETKKKF